MSAGNYVCDYCDDVCVCVCVVFCFCIITTLAHSKFNHKSVVMAKPCSCHKYFLVDGWQVESLTDRTIDRVKRTVDREWQTD